MEKLKLKCLIEAPFDSYSEYGEKSRQFIKDLLNVRSDWDVYLIFSNYMNTQNGYLNDSGDSFIKNLPVINHNDPIPHFDVYFQIANAYEFRQLADINVGITFPSNMAFIGNWDEWINGCNRMSHVLVYSQYSKDILNSYISKGLRSQIHILHEYSGLEDINVENPKLLDDISNDWNFLLEGLWDVNYNEFGGKNKYNINFIITNFLNTFKDLDNTPSLILNVHGDTCSISDKRNIINRINKIKESISYKKLLPSIYLVYGELDYKDKKALYSSDKVKALINTSQREDSVGSVLNFATSKKPIIYSDWSALNETLNFDGNYRINGNLKNIGNIKIIDIFSADLKSGLYELFFHYNDYKELSEINYSVLLNKMSHQNALDNLDEIVKTIGL